MLNYSQNVTSQFGEDGIIEHLLSKIPTNEIKWCVEFGAWDGEYLSNTYNLIHNHGFNAVLIEGSSERATSLAAKIGAFETSKSVIVINKFVQASGSDSLDAILSNTELPHNFDLLSIDVDGIDFYIWKNFIYYRPKIVIIEHNPTIPPHISYVQEEDGSIRGASVLALYELGISKGYSLVCCTDVNSIFVLNEYYSLFGLIDNTPEKLMKKDYITYLISNYDGSYVLDKKPANINIYDDNVYIKFERETNIFKKLYYYYKIIRNGIMDYIIVTKTLT